MMGWMVPRYLWQVEVREGTGAVTVEQKGLGRTAVSPVWGSECAQACVCMHSRWVCTALPSPLTVTLWGQQRGSGSPE